MHIDVEATRARVSLILLVHIYIHIYNDDLLHIYIQWRAEGESEIRGSNFQKLILATGNARHAYICFEYSAFFFAITVTVTIMSSLFSFLFNHNQILEIHNLFLPLRGSATVHIHLVKSIT